MAAFPITEWFVKSFSNTVYHVSQQGDSRLFGHARQETQNAKMKAFDRLAETTARLKQSRHEDTPFIQMDHSRRNVILKDYDWATLVDDVDKIRMLNMPTSEYVMAAKKAFNRAKDEQFIIALDAAALAGENADSTVAHPNSQKIAATNGTIHTGLNVFTLRAIKKKFRANEALEDGEMIYMAITAEQLDDMLAETEITSSDYNSVKALVQGEVDTFMGFKFIHTELLNVSADGLSFSDTTGAQAAPGAGVTSGDGYRKCFAWTASGMISSTGQDITARISERDDKCYSVQPYVKMSVGAVRMEEVKVVAVYVKE